MPSTATSSEPMEPLLERCLGTHGTTGTIGYGLRSIHAGAAEISRRGASRDSRATGASRSTRCRRCRADRGRRRSRAISGYGRDGDVERHGSGFDHGAGFREQRVFVLGDLRAARRVKRMPAGPSPPARVHVRDAGNASVARIGRERLDQLVHERGARPQPSNSDFAVGGQKRLGADRVGIRHLAVDTRSRRVGNASSRRSRCLACPRRCLRCQGLARRARLRAARCRHSRSRGSCRPFDSDECRRGVRSEP